MVNKSNLVAGAMPFTITRNVFEKDTLFPISNSHHTATNTPFLKKEQHPKRKYCSSP